MTMSLERRQALLEGQEASCRLPQGTVTVVPSLTHPQGPPAALPVQANCTECWLRLLVDAEASVSSYQAQHPGRCPKEAGGAAQLAGLPDVGGLYRSAWAFLQ